MRSGPGSAGAQPQPRAGAVHAVIWKLVLLGFGMGLNNAVGAVAVGAARVSRLRQWRVAFIFALFEGGLPLVGIFLGKGVSSWIGPDAHLAGIGLLAALGLYFLVKAADGEGDRADAAAGFRVLILALVLSLDNLVVGFSLGMIRVPLLLASVTFGGVSFALSLAGLELGRGIGRAVTVPADRVTGVALLAASLAMFIR
jgi:putative Mn2+ efflux pump MntP